MNWRVGRNNEEMSLAIWDAEGSDPRVYMVAGLNFDGVVDQYGRAVPTRPIFVPRTIESPTADTDAFAYLVSPRFLDQKYSFFVLASFLLSFLYAVFRVETSHVKGPNFETFSEFAPREVASD